MPASLTQARTTSSGASIRTPSASSRSAEPTDDEAARFPCFAAGPDNVDRARTNREGGSARDHRVDKAGHLVGRLALCGEGGQKAGDKDAVNLPVENFAQGVRGLAPFQVGPAYEWVQDILRE